MLTIVIENKQLYVPQDLSINMELNNSIFDSENIPGDIVFTFDLPTQQNDVIFNHSHYIYIQSFKTYSAIVLFNDIPIIYGNLVIQKATQQKYTCGIIVNPFPDNFAEKKLSENDYGTENELGIYDVDVASSFQDRIWELLTLSLAKESNIKFADFHAENFYSDNEDFIKYVNRCLVSDDFFLYEKNTHAYFTNRNGNKYTLAPQIKLLFLLKMVFKSIGYELIGDITKDNIIDRIYYQSMKTLDMSEDYFYEKYPEFNIIYYNFFDASVRLNEHVPSLTNAEFVKTVKTLLGCSFYIDNVTKKIEMSFVKDIHTTDYIDLSTYLLTKETEIEFIDKKLYTYQLGCFEDNEIDESKLFKPNSGINNGLPSAGWIHQQNTGFAGISKAKIFFNKQSNCYYNSQFNKDTNQWEWQKYAGNVKKIKHSNFIQKWDEEINVKPNVKIPTQFFHVSAADGAYGYHITDITAKGNSSYYDSEATEFDLILNFYIKEISEEHTDSLGKKHIERYSMMKPLNDFCNLTVDDTDSIGQKYALPYIKFLGNYQIVNCKFIFPQNIFLEVMQLLKPQETHNLTQKRWIMIDGIKMLPIQMKFQISNQKESVNAEIKFAKPTYDIFTQSIDVENIETEQKTMITIQEEYQLVTNNEEEPIITNNN